MVLGFSEEYGELLTLFNSGSFKTTLHACTAMLDFREHHSESVQRQFADKMEEFNEADENFTNFSITEILKPDFGKQQITTGVLNLSREKNRHCEIGHSFNRNNEIGHPFNSHSQLFTQLGFQFNLYSQDRLRSLQALQTHTDSRKNGHSVNHNSGQTLSKKSSVHVDITNKVEKYSHHKLSDAVSRPHRHNSGSGGETPDHSPATSPAGSPATSPTDCSATSPGEKPGAKLWPAWVYCTRYSDRPSSGPRTRKVKRKEKAVDDKRPRTAFSTEQLRKLKQEFDANKYLSESRRQQLACELNLNESQIKIWFQNKRAKIKKGTGERNELAMELIAQGLYNHKTLPVKLET